MNLVVGATGILGGEICRQLSALGKPVRALVRTTSDQAKVGALKEQGIDVVQGDLKDRSSLDAACKGVTAVISTASSTLSRQEGDTIETVDRQGQISLVDAAKAAGVKRFVFVSFPHGDPEVDCPLAAAKRAAEEHLKASGMTYTIVRGNFFMEVWLSPALGFDYPHAKATIYGSGENKLSWVSFRNVAEFAIAALDNSAARNVEVYVGGPEALSSLEVVGIFEEIGGTTFAVEHVPEEALQAQKAGATDPLQESFATLMLGCAGGMIMDMQDTLRAFPIQLASVQDYAQAVLDAS